jgi:putative DNA primase/helicase
LNPPQAVIDATGDYFKTEDAIGRFIAEACMPDPNHYAPSSALFKRWKMWADERGEFIGSETKFSTGLEDRGLEKVRRSEGMFFRGLRLLPLEGLETRY